MQRLIYRLLNKYQVKNLEELFKQIIKSGNKLDRTPEKDLLASMLDEKQEPYANYKNIDHQINYAKRQEIASVLKTIRLSDLLHYEYYDEEHHIYQTNRSYGFMLEATTLVGVDEKTDDILKGIYNIGLPDGACIQIVLSASSELNDVFNYWKQARFATSLYQTITHERIKFYQSGTKKRLFDKHKIIIRNFRLFISIMFDGAYENENLGYLTNMIESFRAILKSQYIDSEFVRPEQLINIIREILCTKQLGIEQVTYDDRISIRDQIADPDNNIYIDSDGIVVNDTSIRSLSVRKYPNEAKLSIMNHIIGDTMANMLQISYPFLLCCNIQILNTEKTNGLMQIEAERVAKQSKNGMGRLLPIIDKKAHEYQLMKHLISEGEGFVNMSHYLHIFTPLGKSSEALEEARAVFRAKGWELVNNSNIQLPTILSSLPLFHDPVSAKDQANFRMMRLYSLTNAVNLMPICSDWKGTGSPTLMFVGRRGQVQFIDLFDNKAGNYNAAIVATSGSGKSFLANEIVVSYLSSGAKVYVIDVGRSYKNTCDLLDGQFIEFAENSTICINPFTYLGGDDGIDLKSLSFDMLLRREDLKEQIEMLKAIIIAAAGRDPNNKTEDSFVEQAILYAIHHDGNQATFTSVYEELLKIDDDKGRAKDIAQSIKSYTKYGIHGSYFEGNSSLDFKNNLIVLELEHLKSKGQLVFVVLLIVMLKISQEMYLGDRSQKKLCIIDEAWDLMGKGNSGSFIETGYRRARKYGGSFITATQSIDDYYMNNTTIACWNNADIKFLLRQGSKAKNANFDQYTTGLLNSVNTELGVYSEFLLTIGGNLCGICRLIVDPFSTFIYSSNANDVALVSYIKQHDNLSISDAVHHAIFLANQYALINKIEPRAASSKIISIIRSSGYKYINSLLVGNDDSRNG